ncbi:glycoside hydrolase family 97 protein [candidate division KSB1 bacterium]|nr:glycoside hydrolase family 97 protein [candidate division KSB1 bacterium]
MVISVLAAPLDLFSPNTTVKLTVDVTESSEIRFGLFFGGECVLAQSSLGLHFNDARKSRPAYKLVSFTESTFQENYSMPHGKASTIDNFYNELKVELQDQWARPLYIIFRAYDDGVAFRYDIPKTADQQFIEIVDELTCFAFRDDVQYYGLHLDSFYTAYEAEYAVNRISAINDSTLIGLPLLLRIQENIWAAITEADLENYAGLYLAPHPQDALTLISRLAKSKIATDVRVRCDTPCQSPWRLILLGDHPGRLVESNLVLNLNDPCQFETDWIKPGLAINDWTSDHTGPNGTRGAVNNETLKHYIDFCGDFGLEYMSIDAGWYGDNWSDTTLDVTKPKTDVDIPMLVEYARERHVDVFLWTYGPLMKKQLDQALPLFQQWGVKGLNIDFINSDDQASVYFVNEATRKAAQHKLHIEFHGIYKPTGRSRTYPNLLSHEGVLGLEYAKWDNKPTPDHNCKLPFIRMLAGPLDYIPVGFSNGTRETYRIIGDKFMVLGTRCHSLAHLVIFESGFQVLADFPDNYRGKIGADFIKRVPAAWDETRFLAGEVGEYVIMARRSGTEWFLGGNTDWTACHLSVSLDFLGKGRFMAELYVDGPNAVENANDINFTYQVVGADDTLNISMAPGGGFVGRFFPYSDFVK